MGAGDDASTYRFAPIDATTVERGVCGDSDPVLACYADRVQPRVVMALEFDFLSACW